MMRLVKVTYSNNEGNPCFVENYVNPDHVVLVCDYTDISMFDDGECPYNSLFLIKGHGWQYSQLLVEQLRDVLIGK